MRAAGGPASEASGALQLPARALGLPGTAAPDSPPARALSPRDLAAQGQQGPQPQHHQAQRDRHRGAGGAEEEAAGSAEEDRRRGAAAGEEAASKGAIAQLQEFVQGAKLYPLPPSCPVLQWEYDKRMSGTALEFRATVAFLLDGVPHHAAGAWRPSKKLAQRDAGERALGLFVNRWGELVALNNASTGASSAQSPRCPVFSTSPVLAAKQRPCSGHARQESNASAASPAYCGARALLEEYCSRLLPQRPSMLQWSHQWEGNLCQAFVEMHLFDVAHTFPGKACEDQEVAYNDVARRVLWYLQCPGFEDTFEPDMEYVRSAAQTIPEPPANWAKDGDSRVEEQQLAERKTTIMRVQNRLQQAYSRQLEPGTSVWYWSYERDSNDKRWPPLFRASAYVPQAARTFAGVWLRGQREAQIDACGRITEFLDCEFPRKREI